MPRPAISPRALPRAALLALPALACVAPTPVPSSVPSSPAAVELLVAATTDVHGRLRGWEYYENAPDTARGLSRAATVVDSLRAAHPGRVVLLDAGDLLQGNPLAYVAARVTRDTTHVVVAAMNAMRYDAAAIGNHEFNYGLPTLERAIRQARFPFLAANAYTPQGARAFPAWTMVERAGVKVGIVGATTPGSMVWDRDILAGRVVMRDVVPEVRTAVAEARARGADVVLVTIHSGLAGPSSYDTASTGVPSENVAARLAHEVEGIDVIAYGHSHREMADTVIGTTMLMQPRYWAASVAVAQLTLERADGRWRVARKRGTLVPTAGRAEHPAVLAATQRGHDEAVRYVTTPIGTTPVAWRGDSARVVDSPIVDFILEVERAASGAELASTAAFTLAGLDSGPITIAEIARLYPYENTLRAVRISGRQLREYLEHSARYYRTLGSGGIVDPAVPGYNFDIVAGADYTLDLSRPIGSRVTTLAVRGAPVAETDSFTLALNNYRQTGGGGFAMLRGAPVVHDEQLEIRQLLIDEVARRRVLRPADFHRKNWTLVPREAVDEAYRAMAGGNRPAGPPRTTESARVAPAPAGTRLRIVATNDFHGALEPRADERGVRRGGAAPLAASIEQARAGCAPAGCEVVLLDGGDMWQGTLASNLAHGRPVVELYARLGYAAAALGNHEFDWGVDTMRARMRQAPFRILGANVRHADGRDVAWIPDDTIVTRGALRVGIIGVATTETPRVTKASHVAGLRFDPPAPIVDSLARSLRARGADAVVVVAHAGAYCKSGGSVDCSGEIVDLARAVTERVDAIVSGHTHSVVSSVVNGIPIVQARSSGRAVAVVDLPLGRPATAAATATTTPAPTLAVHSVFSDSLPGVPAIDSLVRRAVAAVADKVARPVARLAGPMRRTGEQYALGNFIADAQRAAGRADFAIMNNGGIRADLPAGVVTYGMLYETQPFDNLLYKVTLTGKVLRQFLDDLAGDGFEGRVHVSGLQVTIDSTRTPGQRVAGLTRADGTPVRDDARYTLVLNDFVLTRSGPAGFAGREGRAQSLNVTDLDALIAYARSRPQPIRPPDARRIRLTGSER